MHERVQPCQDPQTEFALLRERLGVSRINHILRVHGHTVLQERQPPKSSMRLGRGPLRDSFQDSQRTAWNKPRSVPASRVLDTRGRETSLALHTLEHSLQSNREYLNQDAATAKLLPKQPLATRLGADIEAANAAHLDTHDGAKKTTAGLCLQKTAEAASKSWHQAVQGHSGPAVPNPTISECEQSSSASQDDDDDSERTSPPTRKKRLSAPQLQAQLARLSDRTRLRRLKDTLHSKGAWQQVTRIEDLCHTHVSHKWLYHLDACEGSVFTPHDDIITNVQKKLGNRAWTGFGQCRLCGSFLDHQLHLSTENFAAPPKPPWDTTHIFTPTLGTKTRRLRHHHEAQRTHRSTI